MSLIKRLCFRNNNQNRDSFSERVCDDLCEVILQYLSLEDKLRLECVSKQFQRTVFQKQFNLTFDINDWKPPQTLPENYFPPLFKNNSIDLKSLESLLKKCPNITSIEFNCDDYDFKCDNYNEFFLLITKHCNNLVEFKCPLSQISVEAFKEFHKKFGSKLKAFKRFEVMKDLLLLNNFTHLKELEVFDSIGAEVPTLLSDKSLNKLKTLRVDSIDSDYYLDNLINNCPNVRYLDLNFRGKYDWDKRPLNSLSNLKDLIQLKVEKFITLDGKLFSDSFKQMADNCLKFKCFEGYFCVNWRNDTEFHRLLSQLKAFKQLKRLKLCLTDLFSGLRRKGGQNPSFSFESFQGFSNITHLCLDFKNKFNDSINENSLTNVDILLPNLQYLEISLILNTTPEGTTQVADILSRLTKLESIILKVSDEMIGRQLTEELADKCKKMKIIDVKYSPLLNHV